jgi:putative chitinase
MIILTPGILKEICPFISDKNLEIYIPLLNEIPEKYHINSHDRYSGFISQLAHESGSFRYTREIASGQAYENRKDLGNIYPGDGKKFKGRGLIQTTGRKNYTIASLFMFGDLRLLENPELLEEPGPALESSCVYWNLNFLNKVCDHPKDWSRIWKGKKIDKFQWLTILINGGLNGYEDRLAYYQRARKSLLTAVIKSSGDVPKTELS